MSSESWIARENITDIDSLIHLAKLAENAGRHEDMAAAMKKVIERDKRLTNEGRNLFSVAYKHLVGMHRSSHRLIMALRDKYNDSENVALKEIAEKVENDFEAVCSELLEILEKTLIPNETSIDGEVFYKKMQGDYYRYIAEFKTGEKREEAVQKSLESYQEATEKAKASLSKTNPIRLGLALNFSVFYYETMSSPEKACELAKNAFDDAISQLEEVESESNQDGAVILQLIRDNLTLWNSERELEK